MNRAASAPQRGPRGASLLTYYLDGYYRKHRPGRLTHLGMTPAIVLVPRWCPNSQHALFSALIADSLILGIRASIPSSAE
jgi:hypothetical protein